MTPPNRCLDKQVEFVLSTDLCYNQIQENPELTVTEENMFGLQGIGLPELLVVLVIVLIIFGASRFGGSYQRVPPLRVWRGRGG